MQNALEERCDIDVKDMKTALEERIYWQGSLRIGDPASSSELVFASEFVCDTTVPAFQGFGVRMTRGVSRGSLCE